MLLTAGLGTRLRPLTDEYAKPAVPFLGIPLLYYSVELAKIMGCDELVLNAHYKAEQIEALATKIRVSGLNVHVSTEQEKPLGSGGGIKKAEALLAGEDFLVMNGDEVILPRRKDAFKIFVASHHATQPLASLFVMRHPLVGTQFGGVWAGADGLVRGFGKDAKAFGSGVLGYHYVGLLLLSSRVFKYLPEGESNILYDALTKAIAAGETVRAHVDDLTWFETGNSHDFLEATGQAINLLQSGRGLDAELLRSITGSHWPTGLGLQPGTQILKMPGAQVSDDAKLNGFIVADHGSRVAAGARLENCVLMPGADVEAGLAFNNQIIRK